MSVKLWLQVCVKIEAPPGDAPKMFGRHFDADDLLMSRVSGQAAEESVRRFGLELGLLLSMGYR